MKYLRKTSALIALLFLISTSFANAATIFTPTSADVNFFDLSSLLGGGPAKYAIFDDDNPALDISAGFLDLFVTDPFADMVSFTPDTGSDWEIKNLANETIILSGSDSFIIAASWDGATWFEDVFVTALANNSALVSYGIQGVIQVVDVAIVPEPSSILLMLGGLMLLLVLRVIKRA